MLRLLSALLQPFREVVSKRLLSSDADRTEAALLQMRFLVPCTLYLIVLFKNLRLQKKAGDSCYEASLFTFSSRAIASNYLQGSLSPI
jgi:hypothetical protein